MNLPEELWPIWSYRNRWTSGVGGTSAITHDIAAGTGNIMHVLAVQCVAAIAATGTLKIDLIDEDAAVIVNFATLAAAAAPKATIPRLNDDIISSTTSSGVASVGGVWLAGADLRIRISPGTLANLDTVDILILARFSHSPGTVTTTATGTYTNAVTVNEEY